MTFKIVFVLILLIFCSFGCATKSLIETIGGVNSETFLIESTYPLEGGYTADGEIIINKPHQQLLIYKKSEIYRMEESQKSIIKKVKVLNLNDRPHKISEFIKILENNNEIMVMQIKKEGGEEKITVSKIRNPDPYILKRAGLSLLIPLAIAADGILIALNNLPSVLQALL